MSCFGDRVNDTLDGLSKIRNDIKLNQKIERAVEIIVASLNGQKPLLVCGNGGSASDAMHIAGELVGRFLVERRACNVIALSANPSVITAWTNDYAYDSVFSRQVEAHGLAGGVLWGISTSGNSDNVVNALRKAKSLNMQTIGLTGEGGGKMGMPDVCDILLDVPSKITPRIQELHIVIYHYICEHVEKLLSSRL